MIPEQYTDEDFEATPFLRESLEIVDKFRSMRKTTQRAEYLAARIREIISASKAGKPEAKRV